MESTKHTHIGIDRSIIPQINENDDELPKSLQELGVVAYDAQTVEKGIKEQVDEAIKKQRLEKQSPFAKEIENTKEDIKNLEAAISSAKDENSSDLASLKLKLSLKKKGLEAAEKKHDAYIALEMKKDSRRITNQSRIVPASKKAAIDPFDAALDAAEQESEQAKLIRLGKITPFQNVEGLRKRRRNTEPENNNNNNNNTVTDVNQNENISSDQQTIERTPIRVSRSNKKRRKLEYRLENTWIDDGDEDAYEERVKQWSQQQHDSDGEPDQDSASDDEVTFEGGFAIPGEIYDGLFEYQRTGVQWMWELHCQSAGGIIGDEMGLGKTVQIIAFLASLHHSKMLETPSLIVCPATVMQQWVHEFHKWWPPFRVMLLHESSSHKGKRKDVVKKIQKDGHNGILITTYDSVRINQKLLLKYNWDYIVLDEGHKIRNPDAEITLAVKQFPTPHRLVLSGAPIQNNLTELWSIFDFVFPGKLGTLPTFQTEFAVPITVGGYANASSIQVQTAYRCAVALRDLINPYLLRRMKSHVLDSLPKKTEHVLFCQLTDQQRKCYLEFLKSEDVTGILDGKRNLLFGIDVLRKICNHPDLLLRVSEDRPDDYGFWNRSGKLKVLDQLLPMWKEQGHRALVFAQTRQMLDIMESFVQLKNFNYLRLDGATAVKSRMELVDNFNKNEDIFLFLLSTRVGGLGLNLIGADRVLIFDPDWNPSTDIQARERAWRIGQKKDVTIYRLMTSGTIEEKIYHRQIFKQFLTDRILKDPEQQRFFKFKHLKDLFTLGSDEKPNDTEEIVDMNFGHEKNEILMKDIDDTEQSNDSSEQNSEKKDEAFILKKLFDGEDVRNIISHDKLMGHSSHDIKKLEAEADKIAQKALQALKRSREMCLQKDISVPTWTGKSGLSGAPTSLIKRFGNVIKGNANPSNQETKSTAPGYTSSNAPVRSADLIEHVQNNKSGNLVSNTSHFFGEANRTRMLGELVDFLKSRPDKKAPTEEIVSHFKLKITKEESYIFRSMLKVVASFQRDSKCWKLRDDV